MLHFFRYINRGIKKAELMKVLFMDGYSVSSASIYGDLIIG